jgi:DNA-binding transcriptional ArsR family regulator
MPLPRLLWDIGTAYDLFVSLQVLHRPADFGVRGSWAAGIRARLSPAERDILDQGQELFHVPLHWVHALPGPKDAATALWSLGRVPPAERLPRLALAPGLPAGVGEVLSGVAARGRWTDQDREALRAAGEHEEGPEGAMSCQEAAPEQDWWARPAEFGERYLEALHAYQQAFFAEEERRIRPALEQALGRAQELAEHLALPELLEELSQGVRFVELPEMAAAVLAPSFWSTPLVLFGIVSADRYLWLFGARPPDASLAAGQAVPDAMLRVLKALSDPTRLRILHYLSQEPLLPAQLARRLRLRAPTVTHHLGILRLAGLVQLTLGRETGKGCYAARSEAITTAFTALQGFLKKGRNAD